MHIKAVRKTCSCAFLLLLCLADFAHERCQATSVTEPAIDERTGTGPRLPAPSARTWPGFVESLGRRAGFTRDYVGAFASPHDENATESSIMPAQWSNGSTIGFAWLFDGNVSFAEFTRSGELVTAPQTICHATGVPVLTGNAIKFALAARVNEQQFVAVRDADGWITSATLPGRTASLAFSPAGSLLVVTDAGVFQLDDQNLVKVSSQSFAQPSLGFDSSGTSHVAYIKGGHVFVDDADLGEGSSPMLLFGDDADAHLTYVANNAIVLRAQKGAGWQDAEELVPNRQASWPAIGRSMSGARLSFIGAASPGPEALWLVPLPEKEPVLMPSVAGNVTDAWLVVHFGLRQPRDIYRPHDVDVFVNDIPVAQFRDTVPDGRYMLRLQPSQVFTSPGEQARNRVSIQSRHMNPGHYAVNSDYELILRTAWSEHWSFAADDAATTAAAAAGQVNHDQPDLAVLANGLELPVEAPASGLLKVGVQVINLGEIRSKAAQLAAHMDKAAAAENAQIPPLEPGEITTIPLGLSYDGNAQKLTFEIQQSLPDFDPANDALVLTLWSNEKERLARKERVQRAQNLDRDPEAVVAQRTSPTAAPTQSLGAPALKTGIALNVGKWVPAFDSWGWWGVAPHGAPDTQVVAKSSTATALAVPEGTYDVYWRQNYRSPTVRIAEAVRVETRKVAEVNADSGLRIQCAPWVPTFDSSGWWGITPPGAFPSEQNALCRTRDPLLAPPGTYDVFWRQDYNASPLAIARSVTIAPHEVATIHADSGIRLTRDRRVPDFDSWGWWGVVPRNASKKERIASTRADDVLLLPPDVYDVFWRQAYGNDPTRLFEGVAVTTGALVQLDANTGVEMHRAKWVPKFDSSGWWGAAPHGSSARVNWASAQNLVLLEPGTYDIMWRQRYGVDPFVLADSIRVTTGTFSSVAADSGIALEMAPWVPAFDSSGWWGAVPKGEKPSKRVNWNSGPLPLVLPAGEFDLYWRQSYADPPIPLFRSLSTKPGELTTGRVDGGIAVEDATVLSPGVDRATVLIAKAGDASEVIHKREISRRRGKVTNDATAGREMFVLEPGTYDVSIRPAGTREAQLFQGGVKVDHSLVDVRGNQPDTSTTSLRK